MDDESAVVRVSVQAADFTCEGNVHVAVRAGSYRGRVSDVLNESPRFLALTEVSLEHTSADAAVKPVHYHVILLRKDEIKFVVPLG
jgi:hypothetical protein